MPLERVAAADGRTLHARLHEKFKEWPGDDLAPARSDVDAVNEQLKRRAGD